MVKNKTPKNFVYITKIIKIHFIKYLISNLFLELTFKNFVIYNVKNYFLLDHIFLEKIEEF